MYITTRAWHRSLNTYAALAGGSVSFVIGANVALPIENAMRQDSLHLGALRINKNMTLELSSVPVTKMTNQILPLEVHTCVC